MTQEFEAAADTFGLSLDDFEKITINAMKSAFLPYDQRMRFHLLDHQAWLRQDSQELRCKRARRSPNAQPSLITQPESAARVSASTSVPRAISSGDAYSSGR